MADVRFSQVPWTTRLVALVVCPVAGGVLAVLRHLPPGSHVYEFACGYAFGVLACLVMGLWLHFSAGHDALGRRISGD